MDKPHGIDPKDILEGLSFGAALESQEDIFITKLKQMKEGHDKYWKENQAEIFKWREETNAFINKVHYYLSSYGGLFYFERGWETICETQGIEYGLSNLRIYLPNRNYIVFIPRCILDLKLQYRAICVEALYRYSFPSSDYRYNLAEILWDKEKGFGFYSKRLKQWEPISNDGIFEILNGYFEVAK